MDLALRVSERIFKAGAQPFGSRPSIGAHLQLRRTSHTSFARLVTRDSELSRPERFRRCPPCRSRMPSWNSMGEHRVGDSCHWPPSGSRMGSPVPPAHTAEGGRKEVSQMTTMKAGRGKAGWQQPSRLGAATSDMRGPRSDRAGGTTAPQKDRAGSNHAGCRAESAMNRR